MAKIPLQMPYGAVYFRKSNPPKEDWERDYAQAAADGNNIFRHWFMWGNIEVAPGVYDWDDYDRQIELAEKYGIKTIIAELSSSVPEWLIAQRPDLLMEDSRGSHPESYISASCMTGGFCNGLCLDQPEAKELTAGFLTALARRYKGSPALLGYDVWNECSMPHNMCYCDATADAFRKWLKEKYAGDLERLAETWHRYSFTDWSQVKPVKILQLAPESFDWLEFKKKNAYRQMKWRVDVLNREDPDSLKCAHGMAFSLENMANGASDDWLAAQQVDVFGLTFVQSRKGGEDWKQFQALDLARSGSRGKPFWHAEAQGGHLWLQPQVIGRPREDGRISTAEDVRLWNLTTLAGGARGILYPRWRPLLDGALFGAFAPYGMDGRPTERSDMGAKMAKWSNAPEQKDLMEAAAVKGEIGIVVVPESQTLFYLLANPAFPNSYKKIMDGAYRSFFDYGIQADYVHIEDINEYCFLYLPVPMMLNQQSVEAIKKWVAAGGTLISEGCPAYFGDYGHVSPEQPGSGMDSLFGVKEEYVEFTPDLLKEFTFEYEGNCVWGGEYLQTYHTTGAETICRDGKGKILGTCNSYGKGKTILIGTSPSKGYWEHAEEKPYSLAYEIALKAGVKPFVKCSNDLVKIRLQRSKNELYVWIINSTKTIQAADFEIDTQWNAGDINKIFWEGGSLERVQRGYHTVVEGQNVVIAGVGK